MFDINLIDEASHVLQGVANLTPLEFNQRLSDKYQAKIFLKREDRQVVRSFKIRGAYYLMKSLKPHEQEKGVVCASAGNHAQGVAYSCHLLGIKGVIFMPVIAPNQKISKVKKFGKDQVEIKLVGNNFDEASEAAKLYCKQKGMVFVHPFDDRRTIAGQGSIGKEILEQFELMDIENLSLDSSFIKETKKTKQVDQLQAIEEVFTELSTNDSQKSLQSENLVDAKLKQTRPDFVVSAIGGGGLISGIGIYLNALSPATQIIGVEENTQCSMYESLKQGKIIDAPNVDTFVDGTAVKRVGQETFKICQKVVDEMVLVSDGRVCTDMIDLYQNEGIVVEPSGALAISALSKIADKIKGKTVVCVICGGNNDISRYQEVVERSLVWKGLKHYFVVEFSQKPGQLRMFLDQVLGPTDDIVRFEYIKKTNKEKGPALVGVELEKKEDLKPLLERFEKSALSYKKIDTSDLLYQMLV